MANKDRWRGTFAEAKEYAYKPKGMLSISHILDNEDGTYSVMSHINCEWCDYCGDQRMVLDPDKEATDIHVYKEDPYENQKKLDKDAEEKRRTDRAAAAAVIKGKGKTNDAE